MCDGGYSIYAPPSWPQRISGSWKPPKEDLDEDPEAKKWLVRTYRSEKTECQAVVNTSSAAASSNTSLDCDEESMYSPWAFHSMPYATRGYYRLEMSVEGVIERCSPAPKGDNPGACEGGITAPERIEQVALGDDELMCVSSPSDCYRDKGQLIQHPNRCAEGYTDMLCATCEFGYYKSGEWCVECPATQWWQLTLLALVLLGFLAAFSRFATYLKGLGAPRIFFSFVTVTSTFVYFSIDWPDEIVEFFERLAFLSINIECVKNSPRADRAARRHSLSLSLSLSRPLRPSLDPQRLSAGVYNANIVLRCAGVERAGIGVAKALITLTPTRAPQKNTSS